MKATSLVGFAAVAALVASPFRQATAQGTQQEQLRAGTPFPIETFGAPTEKLKEFGSRTEGSIRVMVYNEVNQPGIYYLPAGAVVRDAIQSAGGLTEFVAWNFSCVLRLIAGGKTERIRFTPKTRQTDLEVQLKEGDRVFFPQSD